MAGRRRAKRKSIASLKLSDGTLKIKRGDPAWSIKYETYINGPGWRRVRERYVKASGGKRLRCRACKSDGVVELHHRTYDRLGAEEFGDLIPLCEPCHAGVHQLQRGGLSLDEATKRVIARPGESPLKFEKPDFVPMNRRRKIGWREEGRSIAGLTNRYEEMGTEREPELPTAVGAAFDEASRRRAL